MLHRRTACDPQPTPEPPVKPTGPAAKKADDLIRSYTARIEKEITQSQKELDRLRVELHELIDVRDDMAKTIADVRADLAAKGSYAADPPLLGQPGPTVYGSPVQPAQAISSHRDLVYGLGSALPKNPSPQEREQLRRLAPRADLKRMIERLRAEVDDTRAEVDELAYKLLELPRVSRFRRTGWAKHDRHLVWIDGDARGNDVIATQQSRWWLVGKLVFGVAFIAAGVLHFVRPDAYMKIMPPYLPWHRPLVLISGVAEIGLGVLLLSPAVFRDCGLGSDRTLDRHLSGEYLPVPASRDSTGVANSSSAAAAAPRRAYSVGMGLYAALVTRSFVL